MRARGASSERGLVFDVQRFCVHDGPGIRTTVFLKGCPLSCRWCHNPEGRRFEREVLFWPRLCMECGACLEAKCAGGGVPRRLLALRSHGARCRGCLRCALLCPSGAISAVGREREAGELLEELLRDRVFFEESGGGITLSGGEPMAQHAFCRKLLEGARARGVHCCVETSGWGAPQVFRGFARLVDLFLWDIKDPLAATHAANAGIELDPLLRNLREVDRVGGCTRLRYVLVEGANFSRTRLLRLARLFQQLKHCEGVELLAYHPLGEAKREGLGIDGGARLSSPSKERVAEAVRVLRLAGVEPFLDGLRGLD